MGRAAMQERDEPQSSQGSESPQEIFSRYLSEPEDTRPRKIAAIAALLAHFVLFMIVVPESQLDPIRLTSENTATVIKRWRPPSPPAAQRKAVKKKVNPIPIPDPTPDEPEPVVEEYSDAVVGDPEADFVVGLPDAPPGPGAGSGARSGAFRVGEGGVVPPQVIRRELPEYTPDATRQGIQGEVWIEAVVTEDGQVTDPRLLKGLPDDELNDRALASILRWQFRPGLKDGEPVPVIAVFTVTFRLH